MGGGRTPTRKRPSAHHWGLRPQSQPPSGPFLAFLMANLPVFVILTITSKVGTAIIPILQMDKQRDKEEQWSVQRHTASLWHSLGAALSATGRAPPTHVGLLPSQEDPSSLSGGRCHEEPHQSCSSPTYNTLPLQWDRPTCSLTLLPSPPPRGSPPPPNICLARCRDFWRQTCPNLFSQLYIVGP